MATAEDDKREIELIRAREVEQFISSPLLVDAFANLRQGLILRMVNSMPDDSTVREQCHHQLKALEQVQLELKHVMETGTLILKKEQQQTEMIEFFDSDTLPTQ